MVQYHLMVCAELQPAERLTGRSAHPPPRADSNAAKAAANQSEGGSSTERTAGQACRRRMRNDGSARRARGSNRRFAWGVAWRGRARARTHGRIREGCRANTCGRAGARARARALMRAVRGWLGRAGEGGAGQEGGGEGRRGSGRARAGARAAKAARGAAARGVGSRSHAERGHMDRHGGACAPPAAVRKAARRGGAEWAVVVAWDGGASGLRRARGGIGPLCVNPAMRLPLTAAAVTRRATRALRRPSPLLRAAA